MLILVLNPLVVMTISLHEIRFERGVRDYFFLKGVWSVDR